jgi:hypothetical protein
MFIRIKAPDARENFSRKLIFNTTIGTNLMSSFSLFQTIYGNSFVMWLCAHSSFHRLVFSQKEKKVIKKYPKKKVNHPLSQVLVLSTSSSSSAHTKEKKYQENVINFIRR